MTATLYELDHERDHRKNWLGPDLCLIPNRRGETVDVLAHTRRGYVWLCENTVIMVPDRMYLTTSVDGAVEIELSAKKDGLTVEAP